MQKKTILVATFIKLENLNVFLDKLKNDFDVNKKSVFMFETENNDLILTYKIFLNVGEKINL